MKMVARTPFEAPGLAAFRSAQHDCAVQPNVGAFSKNRMPPGARPLPQQLGGLAKFAGSPPNWGVTNHCRPCEIYLGEVAVMFTTLAFFLIAVLLMLGVIADSLWRRFQRR
jgi:hypothetical protein